MVSHYCERSTPSPTPPLGRLTTATGATRPSCYWNRPVDRAWTRSWAARRRSSRHRGTRPAGSASASRRLMASVTGRREPRTIVHSGPSVLWRSRPSWAAARARDRALCTSSAIAGCYPRLPPASTPVGVTRVPAERRFSPHERRGGFLLPRAAAGTAVGRTPPTPADEASPAARVLAALAPSSWSDHPYWPATPPAASVPISPPAYAVGRAG